jgi:hypothetical protein
MAHLIVLAVACFCAGCSALPLPTGFLEQPLAFNHRLHVEDLGADCTDCHLFAETGVRATIPNLDTCSACHEEAVSETDAEAKLLQFIQSETLIPWRKVYWVPDHVYFSHRRHTAIAGIGCEVCHGSVGEREQPVTRTIVSVSMDGCMECHEETGVSNDCIACHQ